MLDNETMNELKILENPKLPNYIKMALEDEKYLGDLLDNAASEDWLLRWGISTVLVQVSKRSPESLRSSLPFLVGRHGEEQKKMILNNISQILLHLSNQIPQEFIEAGGEHIFIHNLRNGEDHERFDAIKVLENLVPHRPDLVKDHISDIENIARELDNPVVGAEAQRVVKSMRKYI